MNSCLLLRVSCFDLYTCLHILCRFQCSSFHLTSSLPFPVFQGDSGGPLMCEMNGRFYITGVMSWLINNCSARGFPNVFTRVTSYLDWIYEKLDFYEWWRYNWRRWRCSRLSWCGCEWESEWRKQASLITVIGIAWMNDWGSVDEETRFIIIQQVVAVHHHPKHSECWGSSLFKTTGRNIT